MKKMKKENKPKKKETKIGNIYVIHSVSLPFMLKKWVMEMKEKEKFNLSKFVREKLEEEIKRRSK